MNTDLADIDRLAPQYTGRPQRDRCRISARVVVNGWHACGALRPDQAEPGVLRTAQEASRAIADRAKSAIRRWNWIALLLRNVISPARRFTIHNRLDLLGYLVAEIAARSRADRGDLCATRRTPLVADARICRNECVICAHIYARSGILAHASPDLPTIAAEPFPIFLIENQIE